ncbi:MOSC domain-containing protein [Methylocystis bryophila]|uniref:MOSC domain-containing protein n=1 Tax=Methylocystis bryophila TaxID=655015 RepID=A0A1W6N0K6_9HYPH|nr:MOSC domain-containing protein [Methylocystis bryophila]ARN83333.1 MOSC domain-containing protein [Methylocystis bryophila]
MPSAARPAVLVGAVAPLGDDGRVSAIDKRPAPAPWWIGPLGLAGDAQADLKHHGGREKALHHYPLEHYAIWAGEIGEDALLRQPGAFGENLATTGWTEANVCVGDIVRFGGALLQVSQGRQPCWKLNRRFSRRDMAARVQSSGRAGWYYRVLETGVAQPEDSLQLVERRCPEWSLERLHHLLYLRTGDREGLRGMAALPELAQNWRDLARRRLDSGKIEDWSERLYGETVKRG